MSTKITVIDNRRDMKGNHKTNLVCSKCGSRTSAFTEIGISDFYIPERMRIYLCKSCLLKGVDLIDEELLRQARTRTK